MMREASAAWRRALMACSSSGVDDEDLGSVLSDGLADAEVKDGELLLRVEAGDDDHRGPRHVGVGGVAARRHGGLHLQRDVARAVAAMVEVVGAERRAGQLGEGVGVLVAQAATGEERHALAAGRRGDRGEGLLERHRLETVVQEQRRLQALLGVGEPEREATLVAGPGVVDVGVVAGQVADHLAAAGVHAQVAAARAVRTHGVGVLDVEGARGEPVRPRGQCAHGTDLDGVAGER
jgi:hypothetical protein